MATEVKHRRHRWLGHELRMEQKRIPKKGLWWNPPGKRKQGAKNDTEKNLWGWIKKDGTDMENGQEQKIEFYSEKWMAALSLMYRGNKRGRIYILLSYTKKKWCTTEQSKWYANFLLNLWKQTLEKCPICVRKGNHFQNIKCPIYECFFISREAIITNVRLSILPTVCLSFSPSVSYV